jgi:hypothetical protein
MKTLRFLLSSFALLAICAAPMPLRAESEQAAIEKFKTDIKEVDAMKTEEEAKLKGNPAGGVGMVRRMVAKMRTVRTEGLPAELKSTYGDMVNAVAKMEKIFEGWPESPAEFQAFITQKATQDPQFAQNLQTQIQELQKELEPIVKKMDELGKKYRIEKLGQLGAEAAK